MPNLISFILNLEYFIAKRLMVAKDHKSSISAPIIKIAITAIALGVVMMIVAVSTGVGLQKKIREKVSAFNGHIIISNYNDNQSDVSTEPLSIRQTFYPNFNQVEGIEHIQAVASKAGIIRTENAFEGIIFKGVGKDYAWQKMNEYLVEGRLPNLKQTLNNEVIISKFLANRLDIKLNDNFVTYFMKEESQGYNLRNFKVVGIYDSGFREFDSNYIIGDIRHIQKINRWAPGEIGLFEVFVKDFDKIEEKGKEIYEETSSILDSQTIVEKFYYIFEWLKLFDFNIILIIAIMIVVSTINMVVALLVIILEKTKLIGVLKVLGASNSSIRKIFLYNAFFIISKGLLIGNGIGIAMLLFQKYFGVIKLNPENYYVNTAPVDINLIYIIGINSLTLLICLMILIIPSYLISKLILLKLLDLIDR